VPQFSPENISCRLCRFGATARHGRWRSHAAMGVGGWGQLAAAAYVSVSANSSHDPPLLEVMNLRHVS